GWAASCAAPMPPDPVGQRGTSRCRPPIYPRSCAADAERAASSEARPDTPLQGGKGAPPRRPPQLPRARAASGGRHFYESRVERGRGSRGGAPFPPPRRAVWAMLALLTATPAAAARLKDIASIEGVRSNQLSGYGLVAGLNGTGDSQQAIFTVQSVLNMLRRRGLTLNVNPRQLQIKNVAAVSITAALPPFARQGNRID